jgi:hypothetical protein
MKVRLLEDVHNKHRVSGHKGDVLEVDEGVGEQLERTGHAELVVEPVEAVANEEPEEETEHKAKSHAKRKHA